MSNLITDKGIIKLYDGTVVYIVEIQYSTNGQTFWEATFNPNQHYYQLDGVTLLEGHKYMRIRHAGDTNFQLPVRIVGTDGDEIELVNDGTYIKYKLSNEDSWTNLIALSDLKGDKGEQGEKGDGLTIEYGGALDLRPACCESTSRPSGCGCSGSSSNVTGVKTFVSFGNHKMTAADIGNETTYWHTLNGISWVQSTDDHLDIYVLGWKATANNDTNNDALTCNSLGQTLLFSATPLYDSTGKVYACASGVWSEELDLTVTTGQIKSSGLDTLGYLYEKLDNVTIEMNVDLDIQVKDDGITYAKLNPLAFGDGINDNGTKFEIHPESFVFNKSFGLETFEYGAGDTDVRFVSSHVVSDGLAIDSSNLWTDTVSPKIKVNVNDIIENTSGLIVETGLDGYDNIKVNAGQGIALVVGVNYTVDAKLDELSLDFNGSDEIAIKTYVAGNDGVLPAHLNPTVGNTNKGLLVNNSTGLEVKVDGTSIGFNGTGYVEIVDNGVEGVHLNDNVADDTKGIEVLSDKLTVKVDDTTIGFNVSGELELKNSWLTGNAVTSIIADSVTHTDNITLTGLTNTYIITDIQHVNPNVISFEAQLQLSALETYFDALYAPIGGGTYITGSSAMGGNTDIAVKAYIDGLDANNVKKSTTYGTGSSRYRFTTNGIEMSPDGTVWYRLNIDNSGNIDSVLLP